MSSLPLAGPPARPVVDVPRRVPGSVRRSSHVDMTWPDSAPGDPDGTVVGSGYDEGATFRTISSSTRRTAGSPTHRCLAPSTPITCPVI